MRFPATLRYRLTLIYGLAALLVFGLVFSINYFVLNTSFATYVDQTHQRIGNRFAHTLSVLFEINESPDSIERILHTSLRGPVHTIRLLNASGKTLFFVTKHDKRPHRPRRRMHQRMQNTPFMNQNHSLRRRPPRRPPRLQTRDFPFTFPDQSKGTIRIGFYRWRRMINTVERIYLNKMSSIFVLSAIGAILLFSLIAFLIAKSLAKPLERVAAAARRVSDGHLDTSLKQEGVHEIRELAGSFNSMASTLSAREALQKRMTSDVAHELRTPVTILKSHLEGINEGVLEMNTDSTLSLLEETNRLERIINDLRTIWELEKSGSDPKPQPCDLTGLLREAGNRIAPLARKDGGSLTLRLAEGVNAEADSEKLMRAINNLLVNAVKHAGEGSAITLLLEKQGESILIEVTDDGPGIPEEDLPHIFERFYRTDRSRHRESGGAGLGLAITWEAIRSIGGKISARNNPGDGCTFSITLPPDTPQKGSL